MHDRVRSASPNGWPASRRSCATSPTTSSATRRPIPTATPATAAKAEEKRLLQARRAVAKAIQALSTTPAADGPPTSRSRDPRRARASGFRSRSRRRRGRRQPPALQACSSGRSGYGAARSRGGRTGSAGGRARARRCRRAPAYSSVASSISPRLMMSAKSALSEPSSSAVGASWTRRTRSPSTNRNEW